MKAVNNINVDVNAPVEIKGSILSIFQIYVLILIT